MQVTIACDVLGEANNGTILATYNFITRLKQEGIKVNVLCSDRTREGEEGFYILKNYDFGNFINNYIGKNGISIAKPDPEIVDAACRGSDLIHIMLPFGVGKAAAVYGHEHGICVSAGFHCQAENITSHFFLKNNAFANAQTYYALWRRVYQYCDSIHYPTQFIKDYCARYNYDRGANNYVISNGVNTKLFYPREVEKKPYLQGKFVIIMSGRLSKEKGQIKLLKAVRKCKHEKDIQILLCGDGPRHRKLLKWGYEHLSNCPIIKIYPHEKLADTLCQGDLYVHSSEVEIEAISCLEAIACGLVPLIANSPKSATSKFALHPNNSYDFRNLKDLSNKIDYWFEHEAERKEVRSAYIEYTKQFDFSRCMDRMVEMVNETVKRGKIAKPWIKIKK